VGTQMSHKSSEHPFYGHEIYADKEQAYIEKLLLKYKNEVANEELKKKIFDELQMERYHGRLKIPFKISLRKDIYGKYPDYVEVILDTKL
jgi:DNA-directed RNA polymerase subunit N (RpoN/RPB10)